MTGHSHSNGLAAQWRAGLSFDKPPFIQLQGHEDQSRHYFNERSARMVALPLWVLIAACCLLPASAHAQSPVQVTSQRAISGAPLLFQSQPDPEISGRHVSFTESGCALSFSAAAVRGLTWSGACPGGRMQGRGTVTGYDYEQQPVFVFEGHIERGLRNSGVMYEVGRKGDALIGWRTAIVGSALQPRTEMPFLDMPRPFLLAMDDWSRQTDGKDLLASMGATWAPVRQPAAEPQVLGLLSGAVVAAAGGKTAAERRQLALNALAGNSPGGSAGAAGSPTMRPGQTGTAGRSPDVRCAFAKLHLGFYAPNSTYIENAVFQLRHLPLRISYGSKERLQRDYEEAARRVSNQLLNNSTPQQRVINELASRSIREWKDTLTCVEESGEFMLTEGEDLPQLFAFPIEWIGRKDFLPQDLGSYGDTPKFNYPWKACETNRLGITKGALAQVVLHRPYSSRGLHSRFMLGSQLAYLKSIYAELTGESALSASLRSLSTDPRSTPAGRNALAELKDFITGLECEERLGFPLSAEGTFVKSAGRNPTRYPGTQIPRCTKSRPCDSYY